MSIDLLRFGSPISLLLFCCGRCGATWRSVQLTTPGAICDIYPWSCSWLFERRFVEIERVRFTSLPFVRLKIGRLLGPKDLHGFSCDKGLRPVDGQTTLFCGRGKSFGFQVSENINERKRHPSHRSYDTDQDHSSDETNGSADEQLHQR